MAIYTNAQGHLVKVCNKCCHERSITDYYAHPDTADKLDGTCRICKKEIRDAKESKLVRLSRQVHLLTLRVEKLEKESKHSGD